MLREEGVKVTGSLLMVVKDDECSWQKNYSRFSHNSPTRCIAMNLRVLLSSTLGHSSGRTQNKLAENSLIVMKDGDCLGQ